MCSSDLSFSTSPTVMLHQATSLHTIRASRQIRRAAAPGRPAVRRLPPAAFEGRHRSSETDAVGSIHSQAAAAQNKKASKGGTLGGLV